MQTRYPCIHMLILRPCKGGPRCPQSTTKERDVADICLLVEGAYPYVTGGVSSWLHQLVSNLPNLTFAIIHIGARPDPQRKMLYRLPQNVIEFREIFLHDLTRIKKLKSNQRN